MINSTLSFVLVFVWIFEMLVLDLKIYFNDIWFSIIHKIHEWNEKSVEDENLIFSTIN